MSITIAGRECIIMPFGELTVCDKIKWTTIAIIIGLLLGMFAGEAQGGNRHHVVQHHCQQLFVPLVGHSVGESVRTEAIIEKAKEAGRQAAREEYQRLTAATQALPQVAHAPQFLSTALQSCLRCHTGPQAKGGVDLSTGFADCATKLRWFEMAGLDKDVPTAMKPIIEQLRASSKIGDVTEAILKLETAAAAPPNGGLQ